MSSVIVTVTFGSYYTANYIIIFKFLFTRKNAVIMEQRALRNVNNCLNTNIYSYLEMSGGQSSNLYLNVVHCFNTSVN